VGGKGAAYTEAASFCREGKLDESLAWEGRGGYIKGSSSWAP
jgi:hypothetical protein